jgi:CRISPR-associated endonuclease/helicase Cas3
LISVPTGCGKTAAVVLAWLYNRVERKDGAWPRRLVYCLPMRTLVEQTCDAVKEWVGKSGADVRVVVLMGGEAPGDADWDIHPEADAVIIGTQDMLLSRALNRGYGMSRARWPMHFALLNNDCLWVMDETQLMGVGLVTSAQLQAFRDSETNAHTWWMSATLQRDWLRTPETAALVSGLPTLTTTPPSGITKQLTCEETLDERGIAVLASNNPSGTTLVILNTVKRAVAVFDALTKNKSLAVSADLHLVHSRFRPEDRAKWREKFLSRNAPANRARIIVATQVVEAGVDISADTLITELAPWTSLVQRFGRAARYGGTAQVTVVGLDEKKAAPYDYAELEAARDELAKLTDVSIASLAAHEAALTPDRRAALYPYSPPFLLLRREVDELFDTSADLSGADIDISRFIRSGEDTDCQIAWVASAPSADYQPSSAELCPVPIGDARKFAGDNKNAVWRWDYLDREWQPAGKDNVYPGMILLALSSSGGYSPERGFDASIKKPVPELAPTAAPDADAAEEDESLSETADWQTIAEHGEKVRAAIALPLSPVLDLAATYHDIGKAHPAFRSLLKDAPSAAIAKAPPSAWLKPPRYQAAAGDPRPGFRHELASTLALLRNRDKLPPLSDDDFNLFLYLVAAHHGKVRASMQASPRDQDHPVARSGGDMPIRGVMESDTLPAVLDLPDTSLTLAPASIGLSPVTGASWTERVSSLLAKYGPFRLAYLETLLRAADCRASAGCASAPSTPKESAS